MAEQQRIIIMRCVYCQKETKFVVKVAGSQVIHSNTVRVVRYCAHCNRPNGLNLPDNLDIHVFILGQDRSFLGYKGSQNLPVLQGEQDQ